MIEATEMNPKLRYRAQIGKTWPRNRDAGDSESGEK